MAQNTVLNGVTYSIPDPGDTGWGLQLTAFLVALAPAILQKSGGTFTLTSDVNFGASFGLKSAYFATRAANPATTGLLRLSNGDAISFRNFANTGNLSLTVNASDALLFNGAPIGQFTSTANRAVQTNGVGTLEVSAVTSTELGYVSGVTSAIQTQINNKAFTASPTFTGTVTLPSPFTLGAISVTATGTELNYVAGVTSAIQTQLNARELLANKSTNTALGASDTLYPTQNAVKTYVDANAASVLASYRRPALEYISVTAVDVENNTGTANQTKIVFPDGTARSVTEDTGVTSKYRRFIITETAEFLVGTENSGLYAGLSEITDTWYALYAVKSQINAANFVLVGTTTLPLQSNFTTLNTNLGTNGWVYLGMIRNGDNSGATGDILNFSMSGATTMFSNVCASAGNDHRGLRLANTASATSLTYTYAAGTGAANIPNHLKLVWYGFSQSATAGSLFFTNAAASIAYVDISGGQTEGGLSALVKATEGAKIGGGGTGPYSILLEGHQDPLLTGSM